MDRVVLAHDYPGFGESDSPPRDPAVTIEDYAQSLWDVVDALQLGTIDILGYHTGSLVAAEAARQRPGQVGGIVMISAPVFTADEVAQMQATYSEIPLDEAGTRFRRMWESVIAHRGPGVTLAMLAESYAENFRAGENYEWGHRAAFAYAPKFADVVRGLSQRITVLMPDDDLAAHTPRIAASLTNGAIISHPEWGHGFLDAHTEAAVAAVASALDERLTRRLAAGSDRLQRPCDGVDDRGDADARLDLVGADIVLGEHLVVRIDAHAAAVDRRNRQAEQLEIGLVDARRADDVHAQLGRHRLVVGARGHVGEAIIDVVHRHHRGGGLGGIHRFGASACRRLRARWLR